MPKPIAKVKPTKKPTNKPTLATILKKAGAKQVIANKEPVWSGPSSNASNGGITQSLLSLFLMCRERFRLRVIEGLDEAPGFNHRIEYGSMWHVCEEFHADQINREEAGAWKNRGLEDALKEYCQKLCQKYPLQQEQIQHWYRVCKVQFPIYVKFWAKHDKKLKRTPLMAEQSFCVPYTLPSGRVVYLRGKWDNVDLEGLLEAVLQENKTKGDIDEQHLQRQLLFDLQTMIYIVALLEYFKAEGVKYRLKTLRYNVVRRPLSGGRGSIVQKKGSKNVKPETADEYYARLAAIIEGEPGYFFMRWKATITPSDVEKFKSQFLNPVLEQLCDWWEFICKDDEWCQDVAGYGIHYRLPYGIYNPIAEGRSTPIDEYLANGCMVGLTKNNKLFTELE